MIDDNVGQLATLLCTYPGQNIRPKIHDRCRVGRL